MTYTPASAPASGSEPGSAPGSAPDPTPFLNGPAHPFAPADAAAPAVYNLPPVPPRPRSYSAADNFLESSSAAVGAFAGTSIAAGLAALFGQRNDDNVLSLSAGTGSVIGTTLHSLLMGEPYCKILENGIVGFPAAMTGYAFGKYINDGYAWEWYANAGPKQESTDFYGALANGAFAGLGAGTTVGVKNMLRGICWSEMDDC